MEQCLLVPCAPHSKVFADCTEHSTHVQMLNTVRCPQGKLDCKVQIVIGCESQSGQYEGRTRESQDVSWSRATLKITGLTRRAIYLLTSGLYSRSKSLSDSAAFFAFGLPTMYKPWEPFSSPPSSSLSRSIYSINSAFLPVRSLDLQYEVNGSR